jgi:hypothetical protein
MQVKVIVLFVVLVDDTQLMYDSRIIFGHKVPQNNKKDIMDICSVINSTTDSNMKYVDIFGVLDQNGNVIWKDDDDKTIVNDKFISENQSSPPDYSTLKTVKG